MPNPTEDPVDDYRAALVAAVRVLLPSVQVEQRWPGPSTQSEGIYLGSEEAEQDDDALVMGTRQRWANVNLEAICQTYRTSLKPTDALVSYQRVKTFKNAIDQAIAVDPKMSSTTGPSGRSVLTGWSTEYVEFGTGWADRLTARIYIEFRLTP